MAAETKIIFHDDFPEALKKETKKMLAPFLPLLAREIVELRVSIEEGEGNVASVSTLWRYHRADLGIATEFFSYDEEEQEKVILHEFLHVLMDPLTREAQRIIFAYVGDDVTKRYLADLLVELEERAVDGLAHVLGDRGWGHGRDPRS